MLKRRNAIQTLSGTSLLPLLPSLASSQNLRQPKRIIFFLQAHGFDNACCTPKKLEFGDSLQNAELPSYIEPLQPHLDKLNIIQGLHGKHIGPAHSAYYGALGGYRKNKATPRGVTIDCALSKLLPQTPIPLLSVGMESLKVMEQRPIFSSTSAWAAGVSEPMICDPRILYRLMFGSVAKGKQKTIYDEGTRILKSISQNSRKFISTVPSSQTSKLASYLNLTTLREKIANHSDLKDFMPKYDEKYTAPEYETDWHDRLLDLSILALQSKLTNVVTINSGCGEYYGSWNGVGVKVSGHSIGHKKMEDEIWKRIRRYNMQMLVKIVDALESIPEGHGTMMDHTLIVYTSNNADKQHTTGTAWPFLTLGSFGGTIKTAQYISGENRPINCLYESLLSATGNPVKSGESFNLKGALLHKYDNKPGPLQQLLS